MCLCAYAGAPQLHITLASQPRTPYLLPSQATDELLGTIQLEAALFNLSHL